MLLYGIMKENDNVKNKIRFLGKKLMATAARER